MPANLSVMRGNLAANPTFFPSKEGKPAYFEASVYRDRRVRQDDGSFKELDPEKTKVKFFGPAAEALHMMDWRQGDSVIAVGRMGEPEAFLNRQGEPGAMNVLLGTSMGLDAVATELRAQASAHKSATMKAEQAEQQVAAPVRQQADPASVPSEFSSFENEYHGFAR